jgi:N-acetyl-anhydromuramyl-L-alanine amidase AmpD
MSTVDKDGMLVDKKVTLKRYKSIEHGSLSAIHAIVVHQTTTATAQKIFNQYTRGGNGAHFLIDKNGTIYQTASLNKRCHHVGALIKSKCLALKKKNCKNAQMVNILAMSWRNQINALNTHERAKSYPDRYPVNSDSVGIELVGEHVYNNTFETVTHAQNTSLNWLVLELNGHFNTTDDDIYRHPTISYKNVGESRTAKWK